MAPDLIKWPMAGSLVTSLSLFAGIRMGSGCLSTWAQTTVKTTGRLNHCLADQYNIIMVRDIRWGTRGSSPRHDRQWQVYQVRDHQFRPIWSCTESIINPCWYGAQGRKHDAPNQNPIFSCDFPDISIIIQNNLGTDFHIRLEHKLDTNVKPAANEDHNWKNLSESSE